MVQALDSSAGMAVLAAASMASGAAGEPGDSGAMFDGAKRSSSRMADLSNSHVHRLFIVFSMHLNGLRLDLKSSLHMSVYYITIITIMWM